jgi:hypothetical protein
MKAANLARRLQKLEAVRQPFDIFGNMSIEQLREFISVTLQDMGGKDAALIELRNDPGADPDTIKMVEDWPAGLADGVAHIALRPCSVLQWRPEPAPHDRGMAGAALRRRGRQIGPLIARHGRQGKASAKNSARCMQTLADYLRNACPCGRSAVMIAAARVTASTRNFHPGN